MTKVSNRVEIPQNLQSDLATIATEKPLSPRAKEALDRVVGAFHAVMSESRSLHQRPSFDTASQGVHLFRNVKKMYETALEGTRKQYEEARSNDPHILFGLGPKVLFGTTESNEVYKRKRTLEAHHSQIGALLKQIETANGLLVKEKSLLSNRQLLLREKRQTSVANMSDKALADSLPHFSKLHVEVAGRTQTSYEGLFSSLSALLGLSLDQKALALRATMFQGQNGPENFEGSTLDLHLLKYCSQPSLDFLLQELNNECKKHCTRDRQPYFTARLEEEAMRHLFIKRVDGAVEVRLEMPLSLVHGPNERAFATVKGVLVVRLSNDGKTTMKCSYSNVTALATANLVDIKKLGRVFKQEAKVAGA